MGRARPIGPLQSGICVTNQAGGERCLVRSINIFPYTRELQRLHPMLLSLELDFRLVFFTPILLLLNREPPSIILAIGMVAFLLLYSIASTYSPGKLIDANSAQFEVVEALLYDAVLDNLTNGLNSDYSDLVAAANEVVRCVHVHSVYLASGCSNGHNRIKNELARCSKRLACVRCGKWMRWGILCDFWRLWSRLVQCRADLCRVHYKIVVSVTPEITRFTSDYVPEALLLNSS